jgi:phage gp29-like protein
MTTKPNTDTGPQLQVQPYTAPAAPVEMLAQPSALATEKGRALKGVVDQLVKYQQLRPPRDTAEWSGAVRRARDPMIPRRDLLLALYERAMRDSRVFSAVDKRRKHLLSQPFKVVNVAGQEQVALTRQLDGHEGVRAFMQHALDSVFYGHSLMELHLSPKLVGVRLVPREHVRPEAGEWVVRVHDPEGVPFRGQTVRAPGVVLVEVGEPDDLGLLQRVSLNFLYKNNVVTAWAEFAELFGMPMRVVHVDTLDEESRKQIDGQIQAQGRGGAYISTGEVRLELKEAGRQDAHHVYSELISLMNEEMSMVVNGQTLTSDAGRHGSRALGEVHSATQGMYLDADKRLVAEQMNRWLLPLLALGEPEFEGMRFEWRKYEDMPQKERLIAYERLTSMGYRVKREQLEAELGVELEELPQAPGRPVAAEAGEPSVEEPRDA